MDLTKLGTDQWFNGENFMNQTFTGAGFYASLASTAASSLTSGLLNNKLNSLPKNVTENDVLKRAVNKKLYSSLIGIGSSLAGQAAEYAVYTGFEVGKAISNKEEMSFGSIMGGAYDSMGGITFNIANTGALLDLAGSMIARNNGTGQINNTFMQTIENMNRRGGVGMLELNIGRKGIIMSVGQDGTDLGNSLYSFAKNMSDYKAIQSQFGNDSLKNNTVTAAWAYGDWNQVNTAARLAAGTDTLEFVESSDFNAKTVSNGKGRKIMMNATDNFMANAVALGHEAYRDGRVSDEESQKSETYRAVLAHTQMAERMAMDGVKFTGHQEIMNDLYVLCYAREHGDMSIFEEYAGDAYDSSGDFWKVNHDGNLIWDGKYDLYDENGELLEEANTAGLYSSYAQFMDISFAEAKKFFEESDEINVSFRQGHMYSYNSETNKYDIDVTNDDSFTFNTSDTFKMRYDFQINYADKVFEKYGGSMSSAFMSFQNDVIFGNQNIILSSDFYKSTDYLNFLLNVQDYASAYDKYINDNFNYDMRKIYITKDAVTSIDQMKQAVRENTVSDSLSVYDKFKTKGVLNPVQSNEVYETTKATYTGGQLNNHLFGGFAVDIASGGKVGYPVYVNTDSYIYSNGVHDFPSKTSYGSAVQLKDNDGYYVYGHMQSDTYQRNQLKNLTSLNAQSKLWRSYLPAGLQIGTVGNTGNVSGSVGPNYGAHLHYGFRERKFW